MNLGSSSRKAVVPFGAVVFGELHFDLDQVSASPFLESKTRLFPAEGEGESILMRENRMIFQ